MEVRKNTPITPEVGKIYRVKYSGGFTNAIFKRTFMVPGRRNSTHYVFENIKTGREVVLKSRKGIKSAQ